MAIDSVILLAAVATLFYAIAHEKVATELYHLSLRGAQYQNAFTLLDQSIELTDLLTKQEGVVDLLEHKQFKQETRERLDAALEKYQLILFKGAVLEQQNLTPPEFWKPFVEDFCDMYRKYPYIQGWWAGQKTREPYSSLSVRYTNLNYECQNKSGNARLGAARWRE